MTSPLQHELAHHEYFKKQLAERFPDEDHETLADTLEGLTDLNELLVKTIRSALQDEATVEALKKLMDNMHHRRERLQWRVQKKRELVLETMEKAGLSKLEEPDMTVSMRSCPPRLVVTDEKIVPPQYWMRPPPTLMKDDIKAALKAGQTVPGAQLSNQPPTLSVRTK